MNFNNIFHADTAHTVSVIGSSEFPGKKDLFAELHAKIASVTGGKFAEIEQFIQNLIERDQGDWNEHQKSFFGLSIRVPIVSNQVDAAWKVTKFKARRPDMILGKFDKTDPVKPIDGGFVRFMRSADVNFDENVWVDDERKSVLFEEINEPVRFIAINKIEVMADKVELVALYLIGDSNHTPQSFSQFMIGTALGNMNKHSQAIVEKLYQAHYDDSGKARQQAL